ncbi:glycosyltransferase family 2 protein [Peribacillus sp. SCS-37]|uniref:glycosyltransferase family 2 protein n=1 Tax=Paraperibacillus esterisolvens TaxID=3115296 RepID=UPI0039068103
MLPKVSIIVPVFNNEKYLPLCIESIINQTYDNLEIIIINDGSCDKSEKIIKRYQNNDSRIEYRYQQNSGPSEARNNGLRVSTGEYIAFIDSDDTVNSLYIEKLVEKLVATNSELACCGYVEISKFGQKKLTDFKFTTSVNVNEFTDLVCKGTGGVLWGKIFKRSIIAENHVFFDPNIFMSEDLVFVLQYITHCNRFVAIQEYLYHYNRLNESSISSNISIAYMENFISVSRRIRPLLERNLNEAEEVNKILTRRYQDVVILLVDQQCKKAGSTGFRQAADNVKLILNNPDIRNYSSYFSTSNVIFKPYIYLLRNKRSQTSIIYGIFLNSLRRLKANTRRMIR